MDDTIAIFNQRCIENGLSPSQQHQLDMLHLCAAIYGFGEEYARLDSQVALPPLPETLKPHSVISGGHAFTSASFNPKPETIL